MRELKTLGGGNMVTRLVGIGDYVIAESAGQHPHPCMGVIVDIEDDGTIEIQRQLGASVTCIAGGVVTPDHMIFGMTAQFVEEIRQGLREEGKMPPE